MPAAPHTELPTAALEQHTTMARALMRRFSFWLVVEALGLCTTIYFGWDGLLQPVIAGGLVLRIAALGAVIQALPGALSGSISRTPAHRPPRVAQAAGLGALVLSLLLVIDFIPGTFTEAGWDAILNVIIGFLLFAVPMAMAPRLVLAARLLGITPVVALARHLPFLAALALTAVYPTFSATLSPSPWVAWAGALALGAVAAGVRAMSPSLAAFYLFWVLGALAALYDQPDTRAFVAAPAIIAVVGAGLVMRQALALWHRALDRMHDAALARVGRGTPDLVQTRSEASELSEAEALALVDRELGLDGANTIPLRDVSTAEAAAITTPFELQSSRPTPRPSPEVGTRQRADWDGLANHAGRLLTTLIVAALAFVFGSLASITPLGEVAVFQAVYHAGLAVILAFATSHLSHMARFARRLYPDFGPFLALAIFFNGAAALAMLGRGLLHADHAAHFGVATALAAWLGLVAMMAALRDIGLRLGADRLVARFRIIFAMLGTLGFTGLVAGLHAAFAPGDMAWLGAPLNVAMIVIGCGLLLGLAYAMHDARVRFEDEGVRSGKAS